MTTLRTIPELRQWRSRVGRLALVPTMGALHAGHVSLMKIAREHADHVAVSIFVNPTQFAAHEDLSKYPRPLEADLSICREAGVDLVFNPPVEVMYPSGAMDVVIDLPSLTAVLEGQKRPGHFKGVCQVVAKLFNLLEPDVACFGQKDYQQLRVITAMGESLDWPIDIVPCPTIREVDGLALSSRNRYLSPEERQRALSISRALRQVERQVQAGHHQTNRLITTMQNTLLEQHLAIDYVAAVDPVSFRNVSEVTSRTLLAIAARVGTTRLIDNTLVEPP